LLVMLSLLSIGVLVCVGESYYVDPTDGNGDDCSKETPCNTISKALDKATHGGDEIVLYAGEYKGEDNAKFKITHAVNFVAKDDDDIPEINLKDEYYFAKWEPDYISDTAQVASFTNIKFKNGQGSDYDAAVIHVKGGSSLTFSGCKFENSNAQNGSAVSVGSYNEDTNNEMPTIVSFLNCKFETNTAQGHGGAVQVYKGRSRAVIFYNCEFSDNTAGGHGGAVMVSDNVPVSVYGSSFIGNTAGGEGGAIYAGVSDVSVPVSITGDSQFTGNQANGRGGAISVMGGTLTIENALFEQNSVYSGPEGQNGGGVYVDGVLMATNATWRGNACPIKGSPPPNFAGGGVFISGSENSFIRSSTFDSNECHYGSDFTNDDGTNVIIDGSIFESDQYNDADFQIQIKGSARFHDCNFSQNGNTDEIRSVLIENQGLMSVDWKYTEDPPQEITVASLLIGSGSVFQIPTNLNINNFGSRGGTLESTSSFEQNVFTAKFMDLVSGTTVISGFDVVVTDSLTNNEGLSLSNSITVTGTSTFIEYSFVKSLGYEWILFKNEGSMDAIGASFFCDFSNAPGAELKLPSVVGTGTLPLTINGTATFAGNLTVIVLDAGIAVYDAAEDLPLISYNSLYSSRFSEVTIKNISHSELVYGETLLSIVKEDESGLTGGDVAGIVIGLAIALGLVTFGVWFVVIRPQNEDLAAAYQVGGEGGSSSDGGYGAVNNS